MMRARKVSLRRWCRQDRADHATTPLRLHTNSLYFLISATPYCSFYHTVHDRYLLSSPPWCHQIDNDVSDVGSMLSFRAGAGMTSSTAAATSRTAPGGIPPQSGANTAAAPVPGLPSAPSSRRPIAYQRRVEELSGDGSQSEGLDSPT